MQFTVKKNRKEKAFIASKHFEREMLYEKYSLARPRLKKQLVEFVLVMSCEPSRLIDSQKQVESDSASPIRTLQLVHSLFSNHKPDEK